MPLDGHCEAADQDRIGSTSLLSILRCIPVPRAWDTRMEGHCVDQAHIWAAISAITIVADCLVALIPMPYLWRLQLDTKARILSMVQFSLGCLWVLPCTEEIVRRLTIARNISASTCRIWAALSFSDRDWTYNLGAVMEWSCIEVSVSIALASFIALKMASGALWYFPVSLLCGMIEQLRALMGFWRFPCQFTVAQPLHLSDDQLPLSIVRQAD